MNATIFHVVLLKKIHPPQRIHNLTTKHHKNNGTYVSSSCYFAKKCIDSHKHIHNIKKQHNHNACHDISCCSSENMHQTQKTSMILQHNIKNNMRKTNSVFTLLWRKTHTNSYNTSIIVQHISQQNEKNTMFCHAFILH